MEFTLTEAKQILAEAKDENFDSSCDRHGEFSLYIDLQTGDDEEFTEWCLKATWSEIVERFINHHYAEELEPKNGMAQFLLNFVNSFRDAIHHEYTECTQPRCGFFQFDDYRPLPTKIVETLQLEEIVMYDEDPFKRSFVYSPNFTQP